MNPYFWISLIPWISWLYWQFTAFSIGGSNPPWLSGDLGLKVLVCHTRTHLIFTLCHKCNKYNCLPWKMLKQKGNSYCISPIGDSYISHDTVISHTIQLYLIWYSYISHDTVIYHMIQLYLTWYSNISHDTFISPSRVFVLLAH